MPRLVEDPAGYLAKQNMDLLNRDGQVVDIYETTIEVHKVGLERWLFRLAHDLPLVYGALSLALAIAAGWLASAAFTAFRR